MHFCHSKTLGLMYMVILLLCHSASFSYELVKETRSSTLVVEGNIHNYYEGDTIKLFIWKRVVSDSHEYYVPHKAYQHYDPSGNFSFRITWPDNEIRYISLCFENAANKERQSRNHRKMLIRHYIVMPGDSIHIEFFLDGINSHRDRAVYSGKGAAGMICQDKLRKYILTSGHFNEIERKRGKLKAGPIKQYSLEELERLNRRSALRFNEKMAILKQHKGAIPEKLYSLIRNNLILTSALNKYKSLASIKRQIKATYKDELSKKEKRDLKEEEQKIDEYYYSSLARYIPTELDSALLLQSKAYIKYLLGRWIIESAYYKKSSNRLEYLQQNFSGELRDILITKYFLEYYEQMSDVDSAIATSAAFFTNETYYDLLRSFFNTIRLGAPAYNFTLTDIHGKIHSQTDFLGKVVFIDFWYTGCGPCWSYYQHTLKEVEYLFKDNPDVVFLSISIDKERETFIRSVKNGVYSSTGLKNVINLNTGQASAEHPMVKYYRITGYPWPLLIDKEGKIAVNDFSLRKKDQLIEHIRRLF